MPILARQPAQEFSFVHAILEGLVAVDEDDRDFVIELATQFAVAVNVHFPPREPAVPRKFHKAFLDHFAQVAALARINDDLAGLRHGWIVAFPGAPIPLENC